MKKRLIYIVLALVLMLAAVLGIGYGVKAAKAYILELAIARVEASSRAEETEPPETAAPMEEPPESTAPAETQEEQAQTQPDVYSFTEEEEQLLLKLGMAERGNAGCTDCIALVMRTVLNRVEAPKFSSTIRGVIYAQDQFTPVMDGSFEKAVPNDRCRVALERVRKGWDESQGAFYYEWCEGESWHSQNLQLLFQHCDVRFYK